MKLRGTTGAVLLAIGAVTIGAGTVHAQPAAEPSRQDIGYSVKLVDKTVVTSLKGGRFETSKALRDQLDSGVDGRLVEQDGQLVDPTGGIADNADVVDVVDVKDSDGHIVLTLPLEFRVAGTGIPVRSEVTKDATVLELTPRKPEELTISQPLVAAPVASLVENQRARNEFASQFGLATAVGGFVGTAIGATIGCVLTIAAGCIAGFATGASIGGILGTIVVGGPTLIATGIDLLTTLQAADGTSKWADKPATTASPTTTAQPAPTSEAGTTGQPTPTVAPTGQAVPDQPK
ncbi:hypothetical protein [Nocardia australiensis]|uniref:hypothetical protein n=1 Tax=Nocardia australiensis TaxID=2887191 RepID=UPI001D134181|nr:hypothetical protein [Nocardia australiensis]